MKRDADEQEVLHQVTSKLAGHVTHLTVHITKDEWSVSPMVSHSSSGIRTPNINNPLLNKLAATTVTSTHTVKAPTGAIQQSYVIDMSSKSTQPSEQTSSTGNSNDTLITFSEKV